MALTDDSRMPGGENAPEAGRTVLGIRFFQGTAAQAVERMSRGGLLVAPAAPALCDLPTHPEYRDALLAADTVIADSAMMVLSWNALQRDSMTRLSGLEYLTELLRHDDVRCPGNTFWVMASPASATKNLTWLREQGIEIPQECVYLAPLYGLTLEDGVLLARLHQLRPHHIIVTIGGGTQERLGLYLKKNLKYAPAIHCIGAAIAFLSGDQVGIPAWADRFYLGWLFRVASRPSIYGPRYYRALHLYRLIRLFRDKIPTETLSSPDGGGNPTK